MVHHEYVYELEFDDPNEEPLYFVKKETGEFEQWQKGLQPNTVSGCGLLENSQGKCLTSKKICRPHIDDWDVIGLKRQVQVFRGPPFNIRSGGHYKIFTITLGYYLPGRKMNEPGSFISSNVSGSYSEGVDELSPKSALDTLGGITELYTTPDYSDMKHGDPVFVISYALPLSNIDPLHPLMAAGSIDAVRQPSLGTYEFSYQIPVMVPIEGSPVFSESGKVLGFTSMDSSGVNRAVSFGLNPVKK